MRSVKRKNVSLDMTYLPTKKHKREDNIRGKIHSNQLQIYALRDIKECLTAPVSVNIQITCNNPNRQYIFLR